jgi:hypothetical protein
VAQLLQGLEYLLVIRLRAATFATRALVLRCILRPVVPPVVQHAHSQLRHVADSIASSHVVKKEQNVQVSRYEKFETARVAIAARASPGARQCVPGARQCVPGARQCVPCSNVPVAT